MKGSTLTRNSWMKICNFSTAKEKYLSNSQIKKYAYSHKLFPPQKSKWKSRTNYLWILHSVTAKCSMKASQCWCINQNKRRINVLWNTVTQCQKSRVSSKKVKWKTKVREFARINSLYIDQVKIMTKIKQIKQTGFDLWLCSGYFVLFQREWAPFSL